MLLAALKAIFAVLALGIGSAIILWVCYNEFVHQLPEYQRPPLVGIFGVAPAMIGVGLIWARQATRYFRGGDS